ncbi:MAG: galactose mutarotase-like domain-containing protein [Benniella sp.]|nr:MAG: galactose mutarotase-like domain-containing protein [Benniella sp.]
MACKITSLGASLTHLWVPDSRNLPRDVVLGFDDINAYRTQHDPYFGASVGRIANRIAQGQFSLPDEPAITYKLDRNNGPNSLHGGIDGLSFRNWDVDLTGETPGGAGVQEGTALQLSVVSNHMDQGFPGCVRVQCTYRLFNSTLEITYEAQLIDQGGDSGQQTTIVSLTNHAYFNLNGAPTPGSTDKPSTAPVTNHEVEMLNIEHYLETDSTSVPTGKVLPLDEVPAMDFRRLKKIGQDLAQTPGGGHGYDHFYPTRAAISTPDEYRLSNDICRVTPVTLVKVYSPESGIRMTMATTEPGFQLYTANFVQLDSDQIDTADKSSQNVGTQFSHVGKARWGYSPHTAFCLESSRFPDAINHPAWRDQVLLRQGDKYYSRTLFTFSTE